MFRQKTMTVDDWAPFQDKFEHWFMTMKADKRLALFIRRADEEGESTLLIPDHQAELVERLSPGGWEDARDTGEHEWTLLVGNTSAHEDHGLKGTAVRK